MLAHWRRCLHCSKVYCGVTKSLSLAWNQNKQIIYHILHILPSKSVLVFFSLAPILFDDTYFIIARL